MSLIRQILKEIQAERPKEEGMVSESSFFPLYDSEDLMIVMHREAHFGGDWEVMIDYYLNRGKGAVLSFKRVRELSAIEKRTGEDLSQTLFSDLDRRQLERAQEAYRKLREIYELPDEQTPIPRLIADLILSEEEEEESCIQATAEKGEAILEELIALLKAEDFADPLFPGYGFAPQLAARCLAELQRPEAITALFEAIGLEEVEEEAMAALRAIGEPARDFLLERLRAKPISPDTERAAAALSSWGDDLQVSEACLQLLHDEDYLTRLPLSLYLVLAAGSRPELKELLNHPEIPAETRAEIERSP